MNTETIQQKINDRALIKFEREVTGNLIKHLDSINYREFVREFPPEKFDWRLDSMLSLSNLTGKWIYAKLKEKMLPGFIESETIIFLEEIEELKKRVLQIENQTEEIASFLNL